MKYEIKDHYFIKGRDKVYIIKSDKYYLRKDFNNLLGKKINGEEIVGIELFAVGNSCDLL